MHSKQLKIQQSLIKAYEKYNDAIFRHCWFRVRDRQVAFDLMQETFTKTWRYLIKRNQVKNIGSFLYTVANNLIIDRSRRKRESSLDAMAQSGFDPGERDRKLESDPFLAGEIRALLATVDSKYRQAVQLRFFDDLSPKEIAKVLRITQNTASVRISYGLRQMKARYEEKFKKYDI